jgi:hypothetical protein
MCLVLTVLLIRLVFAFACLCITCICACLFWHMLHCPFVVGEGPEGDSALEGKGAENCKSANVFVSVQSLQ